VVFSTTDVLLNAGVCCEKCVIEQFHLANAIECNYTHLGTGTYIACHTPSLYGIACCCTPVQHVTVLSVVGSLVL
jgi:hypothetical protein